MPGSEIVEKTGEGMSQVVHLLFSVGEKTFITAKPGIAGLWCGRYAKTPVHIAAE